MSIVRSLLSSSCAALAIVASIPISATAGPTDPVTVELPPEGQGDAFVPGVVLLEDVNGSYVEEEYFVSGESTVFNYAQNPPLGPTDITPIAEDVPYRTRIIVRRPVNPAEFNGTVVVEWWNSTAGFDTAPAWDVSADYFTREGFLYVGVTNSNQALAFLLGGCALFNILPPTCATRYSTLSIPDDGLAYEMVSQIATLLRSGDPDGPIPADFDVERLYHVGQSQQGGSLVTYASAFHFEGNDGYFIQQAASGRRINGGPVCGAAGSPPYPDCTPVLSSPDNLVRTDLPVPVVHAVSETDLEILFGTVGRQPDTPTFRYYEIAGGGHLTVHKGVELVPGFFTLEDLCEFEINSTGDGPVFVSYVFNALWNNLELQVKYQVPPPRGRQMDVVEGVVQRDEFGNGLGGVRLPSMEAPVATYTPGNSGDPTLPPFLMDIGNLACFLASSVEPFDQETLDELYPHRMSYLHAVKRAAFRLRWQRLLLREDRDSIVAAAGGPPVGCGIGFELTLLLPPLLWARQRRRRRA